MRNLGKVSLCFFVPLLQPPIGAQSTQKASCRALFCGILEGKSPVSIGKIHNAVTRATPFVEFSEKSTQKPSLSKIGKKLRPQLLSIAEPVLCFIQNQPLVACGVLLKCSVVLAGQPAVIKFVCIIRFSSAIKLNCANITEKQIRELASSAGGERNEEKNTKFISILAEKLCVTYMPSIAAAGLVWPSPAAGRA